MQLFRLTLAFLATGGSTIALITIKDLPRYIRVLLSVAIVIGTIVAAIEAYEGAERLFWRALAAIDKKYGERTRQMEVQISEMTKTHANELKKLNQRISEKEASEVKAQEQNRKKETEVTELKSALDAERDKRREWELKYILTQPPWKTVCTDARNADDAKKRLTDAGMGFLDSTIGMIENWSQLSTCFKVTQPIPDELLRTRGDYSYASRVEKAKKFGLATCPWELAPSLRIAVLDQGDGDAFILATELRRRAAANDNRFRLPQIGNKLPKDGSTWIGKPFPGKYLSVFITGGDTGTIYNNFPFVFCINQSESTASVPIKPFQEKNPKIDSRPKRIRPNSGWFSEWDTE